MQTHRSTKHWGLQECPWGTGTVECPPKSLPRAPQTFKDAAGLSRHLLGAFSAVCAVGHNLGGSAGTQQGRFPRWDGDRGQAAGPYQREVVVARVVAGALAFWAEALRAQHQAGTPAPAQAKPVGSQGEGFLKDSWTPSCCREGAEVPNPPIYAAGAGRGKGTSISQKVALSPSPHNTPFFWSLASPHPTVSPGACDALCGFLGAHGAGGGAGWRPCKGEQLSTVGT